MNRPFAEACEQNKAVIYQAIEPYLRGEVLEIGSGTGQHAVYFAALRPDVSWQTSDLAGNLAGIRLWIDDSGLGNLPAPLELDVCGDWPARCFDLVYTANTFHIMDEQAVARSIAGAGEHLNVGGFLAVYGPFNYDGAYTSESNARFDAFLKASDPASGIRDFGWIDERAQAAGLRLLDDVAMPANNRTLIWQKVTRGDT